MSLPILPSFQTQQTNQPLIYPQSYYFYPPYFPNYVTPQPISCPSTVDKRKSSKKHHNHHKHHHRHHKQRAHKLTHSIQQSLKHHILKRRSLSPLGSSSYCSSSTLFSSHRLSSSISSASCSSTSFHTSSRKSSSSPIPPDELDSEENMNINNTKEENNATNVTSETIDQHIQDIMKSTDIIDNKICQLSTTTRMDSALAEITSEELDSFIQDKAKRVESMKRKDDWVMTLYRPWCIKTKKDKPFPLDAQNICAFIRFMAIKCRYALKGIELIVVPCLKRLSFDATGSVNPRVFALLKEEIRSLRHNPSVIKEGEGKPPLCYFDVAELVKRIPDNLSFKAEEASLFLFALHTGSRALTCESIQYKDILFVEKDPITRAVRVIINQQVTKGNPNWNHPVCIEGFLHLENPLDVVYYLNRHCLHSVGCSLEQIVTRKDGVPNTFDEKYVWPFRRDAMRERLKIRLIQAGFPEGRWSFHSLRSGHICSCLLIAGSDSGRKAAILETSSITAGWKMYGSSQRRYIKKVAERSIVSSRLIGAGIGLYDNLQPSSPTSQVNVTDNPDSVNNEPSSSSAAEQEQSKFLMNLSTTVAAEGFVHAPHSTEAFHLITLKKEEFPPALFLRDLRKRFDDYFMNAQGDNEDKRQYCQNSFNKLLRLWGGRIAASKHQHVNWLQRRKLGHDLLIELLTEDKRDTWQLADQMVNELLLNGIRPNEVPQRQIRTKKRQPVQTTIRPTVFGRTKRVSRKRKRWTEEEDQILITAKKNNIPLINIIDQLHDRLPKDMYPRWKTLVKKNPELKQYDLS